MNTFNISTFLLSIGWRDVLDIGLSSYILFRLYALFRGTYVFRVVIGIALLWFFQRLTASLGLIVSSWALQGVIAFAALIIIVVFRNEIRSVLQVKNLRAILWGLPQNQIATPAAIITESAFALAQNRHGALIVIPGKEDLNELIHGGITWKGAVSEEMVKSIFWPDNPVHDGAAIIKGDQVIEVSVLLPLSQRKDLPSYYGTRHRAALGLAENSDAMVIVVSEERGSVAVVRGSHIRVVKSRELLKKELMEHGGLFSKEGSKRQEKFQLATAAVVSALLITAIWFSFTRGRDMLTTVVVPVAYIKSNPQMRISDVSVNSVQLSLSGSDRLLKTIRPDQIEALIDLSEAVAGQNTFYIKPENIKLPLGVYLKDIKPKSVEIVVDYPINKKLPVQVEWSGSLPENLILSGVTVDPALITVTGGKNILDDIGTIYTEKIKVDNLEESGTLSVRPSLPNTSLKLAPDSPDRVTVHYEIRERETENIEKN